MKDAMVRARVNSDLKQNAESIFKRLGLSATDAITLFYRQVELRRGLPFPVELPNRETETVFQATDRGEDLVYAKDADEMFRKLGI